jgi:hypothetical protein
MSERKRTIAKRGGTPRAASEHEPKAPRPSKAEAAHYLRHLAEIAELPDWRPAAQTDNERKLMQLRLRMIADCIDPDRACKWRKGSALAMDKQDLLRAVAQWAPG